MEFIRVDKLSFDPRPIMGRIFVEGFYHSLKCFSKDKERLAQAFAYIFDLQYFYAAMIDDEIAAVVACTDGKPPPISLDKRILCRTLGFIRGRFAYWMLQKHVIAHTYPFEIPKQTGSIEFVATAPEHRGKGAAYGLLVHIMNTLPYTEYVLEVADNNTAAIRLYEKLGYRQFERAKAPRGSGFSSFLYMKYEQEHN